MISQFGITIIHCGQHSFKQSKFWIKSQEKQHGKEQNWPKFGQRQFCQGRWVGNEGQTLSTGGHVFDVDAQLLGQESEDGENDHGGNDWGEKIQGWDETSICKIVDLVCEIFQNRYIEHFGLTKIDFVVEFVIRSKHHQSTPTHSKREEPEITKNSFLKR